MPEYLISGVNSEGREVVEHVEAASASEAVKRPEARGITEVVLHTDDISNVVAQENLRRNRFRRDHVRRHMTARDAVAMRRNGTTFGRLLFLIRKSILANWMLLVAPWPIVAIRHSRHQTWQLIDYILIAGPIMFYVLWLPLRHTLWGPAANYRRLIHACAWGQWEEVLRILPKVEGKISPHEFAWRTADALSALGNLEAGLKAVEPFADGKQIPLWLYHARLASVYAWSHDFESSVSCCQKAAELAPDHRPSWLTMCKL